jgi:hypothetical protein
VPTLDDIPSRLGTKFHKKTKMVKSSLCFVALALGSAAAAPLKQRTTAQVLTDTNYQVCLRMHNARRSTAACATVQPFARVHSSASASESLA